MKVGIYVTKYDFEQVILQAKAKGSIKDLNQRERRVLRTAIRTIADPRRNGDSVSERGYASLLEKLSSTVPEKKTGALRRIFSALGNVLHLRISASSLQKKLNEIEIEKRPEGIDLSKDGKTVLLQKTPEDREAWFDELFEFLNKHGSSIIFMNLNVKDNGISFTNDQINELLKACPSLLNLSLRTDESELSIAYDKNLVLHLAGSPNLTRVDHPDNVTIRGISLNPQ